MATSTGPDLAPAKAAVERLMDDTCDIVRAVGPSDDTLNAVTGVLTSPVAATTIYSGRCKVSPQGDVQPREIDEGGDELTHRLFKLAIPLALAPVAIGDDVTITSSRRDQELVGMKLVVREVLQSTFAVSRRMIAERRQT